MRCTLPSDGRTANRLYGLLGALAVARLTGRTLIIPTHFKIDAIQHIDYEALGKLGAKVITEHEFRRLSFFPWLRSEDLALERVRRADAHDGVPLPLHLSLCQPPCFLNVV